MTRKELSMDEVRIEVNKIAPNILDIKIEPGDVTAYRFIAVKDYTDVTIAAFKSSIKYPRRITTYDIDNYQVQPEPTEFDRVKSEEDDCNPCNEKS
jgi:hypothetical protein